MFKVNKPAENFMRHTHTFPSRCEYSCNRGSSGILSGERGASLIMVMLILIVVSILGIGGAQIAIMSERGARNDRDAQVAWQSAEAALVEAEFDMRGPGVGTRQATFDSKSRTEFVAGCGVNTSGNSKGLCLPAITGKPVWLTTDFTANTSPTTAFGDFTSRAFDAGGAGVKPAKKPRYLIEILEDPEAFGDLEIGKQKYVYRVTAMGFGPREDIQAVVQMVFRKE
jgi:type IV pilus assembly protein PilX